MLPDGTFSFPSGSGVGGQDRRRRRNMDVGTERRGGGGSRRETESRELGGPRARKQTGAGTGLKVIAGQWPWSRTAGQGGPPSASGGGRAPPWRCLRPGAGMTRGSRQGNFLRNSRWAPTHPSLLPNRLCLSYFPGMTGPAWVQVFSAPVPALPRTLTTPARRCLRFRCLLSLCALLSSAPAILGSSPLVSPPSSRLLHPWHVPSVQRHTHISQNNNGKSTKRQKHCKGPCMSFPFDHWYARAIPLRCVAGGGHSRLPAQRIAPVFSCQNPSLVQLPTGPVFVGGSV